MKKLILSLIVLSAASSAFAGQEEYFYGPSMGTSTPSSNVMNMTGSQGYPAAAPQNLNTPKLNCPEYDGSGQLLTVCRPGANH